MRKKGDFSYNDEAALAILNCVGLEPKSTNQITLAVKERYFRKAHYNTVRRVLEELNRRGKICVQEIGRLTFWTIR